eukprot:4318536-Alexandrium_andersonii.AAC.1
MGRPRGPRPQKGATPRSATSAFSGAPRVAPPRSANAAYGGGAPCGAPRGPRPAWNVLIRN